MASIASGNTYFPFVKLMELESVGSNVFKSIAKAFAPGRGSMAYGGHVFAQAVWAAAQTVTDGFVVNSVTGNFVSASTWYSTYVYTVREVRSGRAYCVRAVDVQQESATSICFTCIISFKQDEISPIDLQDDMNIRAEYASVLSDENPDNIPEVPGVDSPWFWDHIKKYGAKANDQFPGLTMRKVEMNGYNKTRSPLQKRQLQYYKPLGSLPPVEDNPNMHACAHLYASDRNSISLVPNLLGLGDDYSQIGSLSHSVIFHVGKSQLNFQSREGKQQWFIQEAWVSRVREGRGVHNSRIWSEDGVHIATTLQDGLIRVGGPISKFNLERIEMTKAAGDLLSIPKNKL